MANRPEETEDLCDVNESDEGIADDDSDDSEGLFIRDDVNSGSSFDSDSAAVADLRFQPTGRFSRPPTAARSRPPTAELNASPDLAERTEYASTYAGAPWIVSMREEMEDDSPCSVHKDLDPNYRQWSPGGANEASSEDQSESKRIRVHGTPCGQAPSTDNRCKVATSSQQRSEHGLGLVAVVYNAESAPSQRSMRRPTSACVPKPAFVNPEGLREIFRSHAKKSPLFLRSYCRPRSFVANRGVAPPRRPFSF